MFGNRNKDVSTTKKSGLLPSNNPHQLNSLVKGTVVEGNINSESDIRIDGTIKGTLFCKSKVIIGPTGYIQGEIKCQNAVVEGRFEGILQVEHLLNVREKAEINGDVMTNKLIVQSGAVFNVSCKMGLTKSAAKKQKEGNTNASKAIVKKGGMTQAGKSSVTKEAS